MNKRSLYFALSVSYFLILIVLVLIYKNQEISTDLLNKEQAPNWKNIFGTDSLGRDMFKRTIVGLGISVKTALAAASLSSIIALVLGLSSAIFGKWVDIAITFLIDLFLALPHLLLLILLSFALGGGERGVFFAIALSHWPHLSRVIRAEALQLKNAPYIKLSHKFGKSSFYVAKNHFIPHLVPQIFIGVLLLFPHAVLHEAALSFLGFGFEAHKPAVGILLAESLLHLSTGYWWLGVLPGFLLLVTVKMFDVLASSTKIYLEGKNWL